MQATRREAEDTGRGTRSGIVTGTVPQRTPGTPVMPSSLPQEALPRRSQPLLAGVLAAALTLLATWWLAGGGPGGRWVHHDAPPQVPLAYTVDLNTAAAEELTPLPGVGPALAARIVAHRDERGGFRRTADLLDVPGIGPATLERITPHLRPLAAGIAAP